LEPKLKEAKQGKRNVFFVDAAHFVWGAYLGYLWCIVRLFIPSPSGRKRYNVLGALDVINQELITIKNDAYINSHSIVELIDKIIETNIKNPITLVMDNAKYQRCEFVQNHAKNVGVELLFLPSYSPHLNIIERLWKWMKKDCLYSKYYDSFDKFQKAIDKSAEKINNQIDNNETGDLFALNFQSFSKAQIYTV
jgi:transposase